MQTASYVEYESSLMDFINKKGVTGKCMTYKAITYLADIDMYLSIKKCHYTSFCLKSIRLSVCLSIF